MYVIYKITNKINNKCYIGMSANVKKRWRRHILNASNEYCVNKYPLYRAFNKYGYDNFTFEIIVDNIKTEIDALIIESNMIKYHKSMYNEHGYNLVAISGGRDIIDGKLLCYKCNNMLDLNCFNTLSSKKCKKSTICKDCYNIYYNNNKNKILKQKKEYYILNKEKILKQKKEYYLRNKTLKQKKAA